MWVGDDREGHTVKCPVFRLRRLDFIPNAKGAIGGLTRMEERRCIELNLAKTKDMLNV